MASTESTLYSPSNAGFSRAPSTTDSDITLCGPDEQEYTKAEPKQRLRKRVAFSAIVTTIYTGAQKSPPKLPKWKTLSIPTFRDSGNDVVQQREARFEGSSECCGSASRKRRFSGITQAPQTSAEPGSNASTEAHYSPLCKRRNCEPLQRDINTSPLSASVIKASESKRGLGRLVRDSRQQPSAIRGHSEKACPSSRKPPSNIFDKINQRVRTTFNRPSFDFAAFSLHRKYVLRNVTFSPSTLQCVAVLDAGVQALLPDVYPSLAMDSKKSKCVIDTADGKGDGIFAKTPIPGGECILAERPVLIAPYLIAMGFPLMQFYADMFSKLSPELLQQLKKPLTDQAQKKQQALDERSLEFYETIMQRYALAISLQAPSDELAELPQHRAIFPQMTKFNHSCGPNAYWKWDLSTFSLVLTAVRPIKAGEEITIAYVAPHLTSEGRRSTLRSLYAFDCVCDFCRSHSPSALAAGDDARLKLLSFRERSSPESPIRGSPSFQDWCEDHSLPPDILINPHLEAVDLIEREGLQILDTYSSHGKTPHPGRDLGTHFDILAMSYGALGDVDNFQKWIGRALESRGDERPEERIAFRKWMSNPMSFPAWARRAKSRSGDPASQSSNSEPTGKRHSKSVPVSGLDAFESMGMLRRF
ncbi:hypothetical protein D9619_013083 [Psilocybe cf. subviscida]|uniref:SET domain-containing protein n=1 Tax=Psilocybe cf. subviscida TaxID=2480587 RepID=A0A8H5AZI2_9AGAR|nr:hypothetical protein D9619_013083 [Psilocybe cf. subviscida]